VIAFILISFPPVAAESPMDIKEVQVVIEETHVRLNLTYDVDPFQKLQMFLFGAMPVKDELQSFLGSDVKFVSVGIEEATVEVDLITENSTKYFEGLDLPDRADVKILAGGAVFHFENTTRIPAFYYS
jgi:hypothetical protein